MKFLVTKDKMQEEIKGISDREIKGILNREVKNLQR